MNDTKNTSKSKESHLQSDAEAIRELSALLNETGLGEIEIEENGRRIRIARRQSVIDIPTSLAPPPSPQHPASTPRTNETPPAKHDARAAVVSPMVGTVYVAAEPGKPPFVQIGDTVREGDTLLIVEAMKTMNPIPAPHAGVVKEICVSDAEPVEFGQTLMVITPALP